MLSCIAAVAIAAFVGKKTFGSQTSEASNLLMQNVEALADNESDSDLSCTGLLGRCTFKCNKCGTDWYAFGAHMKGSHKCAQ